MRIRIYSKVAFIFKNPDSAIMTFERIGAGEIKDLPAWVAKTVTFKEGVRGGLIEVIQNREAEVKAELDAAKRASRSKKAGM